MECAVLCGGEDVVLVVEAVDFGGVGGHVVVAGGGVAAVVVGVEGVGFYIVFAGRGGWG